MSQRPSNSTPFSSNPTSTYPTLNNHDAYTSSSTPQPPSQLQSQVTSQTQPQSQSPNQSNSLKSSPNKANPPTTATATATATAITGGNNNNASRPSTNSTSAPSPRTNPRSCVTCRRRKVRCNKEDPCANCIKAGIECRFPGPNLPPRKTKKVPDVELLARLKRLEGVVNSLGAHVGGDGKVIVTGPTGPTAATAGPDGRSARWPEIGNAIKKSSTIQPEDEPRRTSTDINVGRLVIDDDRSRYVSNSFWAKMGDEIAEMRDLLDPPTSEDEAEQDSPQVERFGSHQAFLFGYSSIANDLHDLHPSPSQVFILWEVFKENVDPIVKILHRPTAKNLLLNAASNVERVSRTGEALLFSIYLGAVTSLNEQQCLDLLSGPKDVLTKRYRFATEQALARADFVNSSSLMCLQALILFLQFVRYSDGSRFVWVMSALVMHLARALGLHRDGKNFDLSPFDTEMRRRLWWSISILDHASAEDQGADCSWPETGHDTQLPLNINDDDMHPGMKEPPAPRLGFSDMTFSLVHYEVLNHSRRINKTNLSVDKADTNTLSLDDKEKLIDECSRTMEEKYLRHFDMTVPLAWVSATVTRLILAKMWLAAHHRRRGENEQGSTITPELRQRLFITSLEVVEFAYLLEHNENSSRCGWIFRSYMQWQAIVFILSELCVRPPGPEYERAWSAVETVCAYRENQVARKERSLLWKPIRLLMARAKARRIALQNGQPDPALGQNLGSNGIARSSNNSQTPDNGRVGFQSPSNISDSWPPDPSQTFLGNTVDAFGLDVNEFIRHTGWATMTNNDLILNHSPQVPQQQRSQQTSAVTRDTQQSRSVAYFNNKSQPGLELNANNTSAVSGISGIAGAQIVGSSGNGNGNGSEPAAYGTLPVAANISGNNIDTAMLDEPLDMKPKFDESDVQTVGQRNWDMSGNYGDNTTNGFYGTGGIDPTMYQKYLSATWQEWF